MNNASFLKKYIPPRNVGIFNPFVLLGDKVLVSLVQVGSECQEHHPCGGMALLIKKTVVYGCALLTIRVTRLSPSRKPLPAQVRDV